MMIMYAENPNPQRDLLFKLDDLTSEQTQALDSGDMEVLNVLSELRMQAMRDAAPFLPPYKTWDPELIELAAQVQERSAQLQHEIHACMAIVRRELANLDKQQQVVTYLADYRVQQQTTWQG